MNYLILCEERPDGMCLWWRPRRRGYTTDIQQAGRYSKEEAHSIYQIRGTDFPVPEGALGTQLMVRAVVTLEDGGNLDAIRYFESVPGLSPAQSENQNEKNT